jgi:predicted DsbA family dithiol-disulfide isomerase
MIYENGENVSTLDALVAAAEQLGIPNAAAYLQSDEDVALVQKQAREASRAGISGVPFFVVYKSDEDDAEPITLSGAQPPKAFLQVCIRAGGVYVRVWVRMY